MPSFGLVKDYICFDYRRLAYLDSSSLQIEQLILVKNLSCLWKRRSMGDGLEFHKRTFLFLVRVKLRHLFESEVVDCPISI